MRIPAMACPVELAVEVGFGELSERFLRLVFTIRPALKIGVNRQHTVRHKARADFTSGALVMTMKLIMTRDDKNHNPNRGYRRQRRHERLHHFSRRRASMPFHQNSALRAPLAPNAVACGKTAG